MSVVYYFIPSKALRGTVGSAAESLLVSREFEPHLKLPLFPSLSKKPYPHCLVLIGFRNVSERELH